MKNKRVLSFIMAFVLCLSLLPFGALAAEEEPAAEEIILEEESETAAETEEASEITETEESSVPEKSAEPAPEIIEEESEDETAVLPEDGEAVVSGECGNNMTWTLDDEGALTISGTGEMCNYSYPGVGLAGCTPGWDEYRSSIQFVYINEGVTSVGTCAFYGCNNLVGVILSESVSSIAAYSFYGCRKLTSIEIRANISVIDPLSFAACFNLLSFSVSEDNDFYCSLDGVLYTKDQSELVCCPEGISGIISVSARTKKIASHAFYFCNDLIRIEFQDGLTEIGEYAFYCCTGLTVIELPDSVTQIGKYAFCSCHNLSRLDLGESLTSIEWSAFSGCEKLTELTIPNTVTSIDGFAFSSCKALSEITIPDSVTSISYGAFSGCSSLTSIDIPDSVTSIGNSVFSGCSSLTSITIPNSVTGIGNFAFSGCSSLTAITIPDSVTTIGSEVFDSCSIASIYYGGTQSQWTSLFSDVYLAGAKLYCRKYEIMYIGRGATGGLSDAIAVYGEPYTIPDTMLTKTGYKFLGWAKSINATEAAYLPGESYINLPDALYAVWKANISTVTFNANGGKGGPGTAQKTYGKAITVPTTVPTRAGYTFLGWSNSKTATTAKYLPGKSYSSIYLTLYAVWKANVSTVTFNANGGTGGPKTGIKAKGVAYTIPTTKPTRTGYTFLGWSGSKTATKASYLPGKTYSSIYLTLYAVWGKVSTITFHANGGTGAPASGTKTYGVAYTIPTAKPTFAGYTFLGWSNVANATTAKYLPGKSYTSIYLTLYAVWKKN